MNFRKALLLVGSFMFATSAFAQDGTGGANLAPLASALAIGLAVIGGAWGQGVTAKAALEGIARNPAAQGKIFVPMIIGLALIESLVLYAFVIAFVKIS